MREINEAEVQRRLEALAQVQPSEQSAQRAIARARSALAQAEPAPEKPRNPVLWSIIMRSHVAKFAAAAVIVVAAITSFHLFFGGGAGIALAQVYETVQEIQNVIYRMSGTMKGLPGAPEGQTMSLDIEAKLVYDVGFRMDSSVQIGDEHVNTIAYVVFEDEVTGEKGVIYQILPKQKKYMKMTLTAELLEQMEKDNGDPRQMLEQMMEYEDKVVPLGRDEIDGIEVEGFEVTDVNMADTIKSGVGGAGLFDEFAMRLWVDVDTKLPVSISIKASADNDSVLLDLVMDGFQWDAQFDSEEVKPYIPEDCELLMDGEFGGSSDGKDIIESLEFFAEVADGKYPSSLTSMTVMKEFVPELRSKLAGQPNSEPTPEELGKVMKLQSVGMTYASFVKDGNNPAYYGDTVTAEFPHAVLLRWKIDENTYKVVFGDLSTEDVTPERLAELESQPLNIDPKPVKPEPADGTSGMSLTDVSLSWIAGAYATQHKVYFGTSAESLALLATTEGTDCDTLPSLERETTYYWRVDAVTADGTVTQGAVWSFSPGSLVAHWKLDDESGDVAADSTANKLDAALLGDPVWGQGVVGGALNFDGDGDYLDCSNDPRFEIVNQITVSVWIKVSAFDRPYQTIISKGDTSWRLQRTREEKTLEFGCSGALVPTNPQWGGIYGKIEVNDGQWHHVAGTYDGANICLYVDGKLDVSSAAPGRINVNDHNVWIGANAEEPDRFWNGLIDDVQVFNYAMNSDEIAAMAQ